MTPTLIFAISPDREQKSAWSVHSACHGRNQPMDWLYIPHLLDHNNVKGGFGEAHFSDDDAGLLLNNEKLTMQHLNNCLGSWQHMKLRMRKQSAQVLNLRAVSKSILWILKLPLSNIFSHSCRKSHHGLVWSSKWGSAESPWEFLIEEVYIWEIAKWVTPLLVSLLLSQPP